MSNGQIWIAILVAAGVSLLVRVLPLTLIRKKITNRFLRSFLYYVPYATLAVMTFPAIIDAGGHRGPGDGRGAGLAAGRTVSGGTGQLCDCVPDRMADADRLIRFPRSGHCSGRGFFFTMNGFTGIIDWFYMNR